MTDYLSQLNNYVMKLKTFWIMKLLKLKFEKKQFIKKIEKIK